VAVEIEDRKEIYGNGHFYFLKILIKSKNMEEPEEIQSEEVPEEKSLQLG